MATKEHPLAQAERHIAAAEARIARLRNLADELARDGHREAAARAEDLILAMGHMLMTMRRHRDTIAAALGELAETPDDLN
jgi:hypothetical protein